MFVKNQCIIEDEFMFVIYICCYNKRGVVLEELNPHLLMHL